LVDENRAAATTNPVQLLAEWPDTCLLISSWLGHLEIIKALLEKGVPVFTSDNDGRFISLIIYRSLNIYHQKIEAELLKTIIHLL